MSQIKLRKIGKKDKCPPSWCPRLKYERCCFACEFHVEKDKYILYCGHPKSQKK